MKNELYIDAFEYNDDQKRILENAKYLYLDNAEMIEHYSYVNMRHQLSSTNYALEAEKEFIMKKFNKFKNTSKDFDNLDYKNSYIKIKALYPEEISDKKIVELLCDTCAAPVVIKGLMKDTKAVKNWDHQFFIKNYGDVEIYGMDYSKNEATEKNLGFGDAAKKINAKYILENQLDPRSKETFYINNSVDFFAAHPSLLNDVETTKINEKIKDLVTPLYPHLFIGNLKTWGTDWHLNNDISATVAIEGTKRWFFMDPLHAYSLQLIPTPHSPVAMLSSSFVGGSTSIRYDLDYHFLHNPVYAYAPKFYYDQEPGDVIIFPKWWPHAIINQSELSIMVNQRYTEVNLAENKKSFKTAIRMPLYEGILRSDPRYRDHSFEVYQSLQKEEIISPEVYFKQQKQLDKINS
ncbi:cupin-like domain-containing protein [Aquimarina sp. RZ0]|uniref:cupin-like domain-containing protein n=1 Tax=Aquimarina sp. RZ0 TaxID=2607730 RepID=UPI0011F22E34|nr:cupin-like domain-containing protein [Aquimarina sp. RZ0]KAA1246071.1 hypothetical protein F0000_09480 [Aquimarina sp. RZ0]